MVTGVCPSVGMIVCLRVCAGCGSPGARGGPLRGASERSAADVTRAIHVMYSFFYKFSFRSRRRRATATSLSVAVSSARRRTDATGATPRPPDRVGRVCLPNGPSARARPQHRARARGPTAKKSHNNNTLEPHKGDALTITVPLYPRPSPHHRPHVVSPRGLRIPEAMAQHLHVRHTGGTKQSRSGSSIPTLARNPRNRGTTFPLSRTRTQTTHASPRHPSNQNAWHPPPNLASTHLA